MKSLFFLHSLLHQNGIPLPKKKDNNNHHHQNDDDEKLFSNNNNEISSAMTHACLLLFGVSIMFFLLDPNIREYNIEKKVISTKKL